MSKEVYMIFAGEERGKLMLKKLLSDKPAAFTYAKELEDTNKLVAICMGLADNPQTAVIYTNYEVADEQIS